MCITKILFILLFLLIIAVLGLDSWIYILFANFLLFGFLLKYNLEDTERELINLKCSESLCVQKCLYFDLLE